MVKIGGQTDKLSFPSSLPVAIVRLNLTTATGKEDEKLSFNKVNSAYKLTFSRILPVAEGLGKCIHNKKFGDNLVNP